MLRDKFRGFTDEQHKERAAIISEIKKCPIKSEVYADANGHFYIVDEGLFQRFAQAF